MAATRQAKAIWTGDLMKGTGEVSAVSSAKFSALPVSWASRTEDVQGRTSPEELLAAAHASCFAMALSAGWLSFVGPLVMWLIYKDRSPFVRQAAAELESIYEVYVTDPRHKLLGVLSLKELIGAAPQAPIGQVMRTELVQAQVDDPQDEVARLIAKYNLLALPIVDAGGVLRGIVTVDDAMDVILPEQWKARVPRVYQRG